MSSLLGLTDLLEREGRCFQQVWTSAHDFTFPLLTAQEMARQGSLTTPSSLSFLSALTGSIFILSGNFQTSSSIPTTKPCLDLHWV